MPCRSRLRRTPSRCNIDATGDVGRTLCTYWFTPISRGIYDGLRALARYPHVRRSRGKTTNVITTRVSKSKEITTRVSTSKVIRTAVASTKAITTTSSRVQRENCPRDQTWITAGSAGPVNSHCLCRPSPRVRGDFYASVIYGNGSCIPASGGHWRRIHTRGGCGRCKRNTGATPRGHSNARV